MPSIRRQRLRKPTKRSDLLALREALADGKVHVSLAIVVLEGPSHFEVVEGADILVDVELQPSGVRCTARLGGMGVYAIPPVGAEVVVLVPDGELEAGPVIVARSGEAPNGLDATTLVVVVPPGGQLVVHDGAASEAKRLVTHEEFMKHGHPTAATGPTSGPTTFAGVGPATPGVELEFPSTQTLRAK